MGRRANERRADLWRRRLTAWHRSSGTICQFCEQRGLSVASFYYWRRRLGWTAAPPAPQLAKGSGSGPRSLFVPVSVRGSSHTDRFEIELPNRTTLRLPATCKPTLIIQLLDAAGRIQPIQPAAVEDSPC
jgi:hypothetical protein